MVSWNMFLVITDECYQSRAFISSVKCPYYGNNCFLPVYADLSTLNFPKSEDLPEEIIWKQKIFSWKQKLLLENRRFFSLQTRRFLLETEEFFLKTEDFFWKQKIFRQIRRWSLSILHNNKTQTLDPALNIICSRRISIISIGKWFSLGWNGKISITSLKSGVGEKFKNLQKGLFV